MIYCDTSLLVSALTLEARTLLVQRWLAGQRAGSLCVSDWVGTELSSALSIKLRRGDVTPDIRTDALLQWRGMLATSLMVIGVPTEVWNLATSYCDRQDLNLRASDALHVAIASLGGHSLATLDRVMADAALAIGLRVEDISAS